MKNVAVNVVPGAKIERIKEASDGSLKVWVRGKPIDGKANQAVIGVLAKHYNLSKGRIKIIHGLTSRQKVVEIEM